VGVRSLLKVPESSLEPAGGRFGRVTETPKFRLGPASATSGKEVKFPSVAETSVAEASVAETSVVEASVVEAPETCPGPANAPTGGSCCAMELPETCLEPADATASKERTQAMSWTSEYQAPKA
jgi:hypothetical protein